MPEYTLVVETYEDASPTPVLTHAFHGATAAEAEGIMHAHAHYDAFLRASLTTGAFQGMRLTNRYRWD
jgi:hypothetical protein